MLDRASRVAIEQTTSLDRVKSHGPPKALGVFYFCSPDGSGTRTLVSGLSDEERA